MADEKYDDDKNYSVNLNKVVDFEGFTLKPGPNPVEMKGEWCNMHADSIADAVEIPKPVETVQVQAETHETAK